MDRLGPMETYTRVVEAGSLSSAARRLGVGQPAISKSIARLEKLLGVRLLIRSQRGLKPSEAGRTYYEHARRTIAEADEADFAARATDTRLAGRLQISAGITFTKLYLVPCLSAFLAAYPNLSVEFILHDGEIDLIEEGVDISLQYGPLSDCALVGRRLASTRRLVLATPKYFHRVGILTCPAELLNRKAVVDTHDIGATSAWSFRKEGIETSIRIPGRLSASEAMRSAVLGGLGFTIASQWTFAPGLASGAIRAVLTEWALPDVELWMIFRMGRMTNARTRAFATFVERKIDPARADQIGNHCEAGSHTPIAISVRRRSRSENCAIRLQRCPDAVAQALVASL